LWIDKGQLATSNAQQVTKGRVRLSPDVLEDR
jgi:uncharacterized protein (DUF849 family)